VALRTREPVTDVVKNIPDFDDDMAPRKNERPSDHAPVVVELALR